MKQLNFVDAFIQHTLAPKDSIKKIFNSIDWEPICSLFPNHTKGRKAYDPVAMIKALLLLPLGYASSLRDLARKLKENARLAYLCGFSFGNTPQHNTFSLFINRLIEEDRILKAFHILVAQIIVLAKLNSIEIAIDGTHLEAQKQDKDARWGFKSQQFSFFGYKVIITTSVSEPIFPIAIDVKPGNESETPCLVGIVKQIKEYHPDLKVKKVFGDAGYDSNENHESIIKDLGAIPFVAINPRGRKNPFLTHEVYRKDGKLYCWAGHELIYYGRELKRNRIKYRCPAALDKGNCLFYPCSSNSYGRSFYIGNSCEYRLLAIALASQERWKKEYKSKRYIIEQLNSILKNARGMKRFYLRSQKKVRFFAILCAMSQLAIKISQQE